MQVEVVRSVADWLNSATTGVNIEIPNVPRDGGDPEPSHIVAVLDETRSAIVALKRIPDDQATPFVLVWVPDDAEFKAVNQAKQDAPSFPVMVGYVDRDINAQTAVRDGGYVLRAIRRSLNRFHDNANLASRTRNSIEVRNGNIRMRQVRPTLDLEGAVITGGIGITYAVRDILP